MRNSNSSACLYSTPLPSKHLLVIGNFLQVFFRQRSEVSVSQPSISRNILARVPRAHLGREISGLPGLEVAWKRQHRERDGGGRVFLQRLFRAPLAMPNPSKLRIPKLAFGVILAGSSQQKLHMKDANADMPASACCTLGILGMQHLSKWLGG